MGMHFLSDSEVALLQRLLDVHRGQLGNMPSRPPTERSWDEGEDHQAPEVYIAYPQTHAGIPVLLSAGTGTGESDSDYDEPGKAECDIYKIVENDTTGDPELHDAGFSKDVYNLTPSAIDQDWVSVARTKFGKWLAIASVSTAGATLEWAILDETLSEGSTATASIYRGGPSVEDLADSGENVTVGAPPLMGSDTGTGPDVDTIASGSWVLIVQMDDGYWWIIGAPC